MDKHYMNYLVSLYFDDKTETRLRTYIAKTAEKCGNTYMIDHHVPPHITVSALDTMNEETMIQKLENCISQLDSGTLQWVTIGTLNSGVIYMAPVLNEYLHGLAVNIYDSIKMLPNVKVSKYYRPFQWLPHATIAKKLTRKEMTEAFMALQDSFAVFEGKVVKIGLAQKNPYREIRDWELKTNKTT